METKEIFINPDNIDASLANEAGSILKNGGLVAFPTETVYGLGANAFDDVAVGSIFTAKGRPNDTPLIVHVASKEDVEELVESVSEKAKPCLKRWDVSGAKTSNSGKETSSLLPNNKVS